MSFASTETLSASDLTAPDEADYRSVSGGAVASAIVGALSVLMLLAASYSFESALMMALLPMVGIVLGVLALRRIKASPEQYTGAGAAKLGVGLSAGFLLAGLGYAGYVHATEVPNGYTRTSFAE